MTNAANHQNELVESGRALRLGLRLMAFFLGLYFLFWIVIGVYFSYAERNKDLLETTLGKVFKRDVQIEEIVTAWDGLSPLVQIRGFTVVGDRPEQPALSFDLLSAEISPLSILRFWPQFTELTIQAPRLEIVSLGSQGLMMAGIVLNQSSQGGDPQQLIQWLVNHENIAWVNGEVNWQRADGGIRHYKNLSFLYSRADQSRVIDAVVSTPKGGLRFHSESYGDLFSKNDWDANFQVMGNQEQQLLAPDDLSFVVNNGQGRLRIKTLDVERIRDFIQLTGLAEKAAWLFDAQLAGRLHDATFAFSGSLFDIVDWSLIASASDISFKSIGSAPSMNNLAGSVNISSTGGKFSFSTQDSVFQWNRWFDQQFPIDLAEGEFSWQIQESGNIDLALSNGRFEDKNARIFNFNAHLDLDKKSKGVTSLDELLALISITRQIKNSDSSSSQSAFKAPVLNASAEYDFFKMEAFDEYLPNDKRVGLLKKWWANAYKSGESTGATITYTGELSAEAFFSGQAQLESSGDFANVHIDYGYLQDWPEVKKGRGRFSLKNDLFTLNPDEVWLEEDKVTQSKLQIFSLFNIERTLVLESELTTSLANVAEFLFAGPLIKPENKPEALPVTVTSGVVDSVSVITVPLSHTTKTTVVGKAKIADGRVVLPSSMPVDDISANISFTERSAQSNNIKASFLGGLTTARLETTQEALPPKLRMSASGSADMQALIPWTGEHLSTLFDGRAPWQGTVDLNGADIAVVANSTLKGVEVLAPAPLAKPADEVGQIEVAVSLGSLDKAQTLTLNYNDLLSAVLETNPAKPDQSPPSFFDKSMISLGKTQASELAEGINFDAQVDSIDLDAWFDTVIDLAQYKPNVPTDNTEFLDAMRTVRIKANDSMFLGRPLGEIDLSAVSVDGQYWIGAVRGSNANGTWQAQPRATLANYVFNFSDLNFAERIPQTAQVEPINYSLKPQEYPTIALKVDELKIGGRHFGTLTLSGSAQDEQWQLNDFELAHNGIRTSVSGAWTNNQERGSVSLFDYEVTVDEAEGALDDMDFDGFIKKGTGSMTGKINWLGAPHEFDYSRLGGDFYLRIRDGELVKVEPGTGKLLGLLNFNALARRLTFDFRDVFASGLKFDRMVYSGILADGEAIMREAYVLTPAVFVRLEGKVDLGKELVDMEIHIAPELAGNLTLLSALANPAAGAVVFLTQRIFKDEMRQASFRSYRALGTWQDFELVDLDKQDPDKVITPESKPEPDKPVADKPEFDEPIPDKTANE